MRAATSRPRREIKTRFGVLIVRDQLEPAEHIDRLRLSAVPTWSASTGFELLWLLEHMGARPSLVLLDLRPVTDHRAARVADLASLAAAAKLPTILVGADGAEAKRFPDVVAALPADVTSERIVDMVHAFA